MVMRVPSGITAGSTATMPGPVGMPVAVVPRIVYAVATTVSVLPDSTTGACGEGWGCGCGWGSGSGGGAATIDCAPIEATLGAVSATAVSTVAAACAASAAATAWAICCSLSTCSAWSCAM